MKWLMWATLALSGCAPSADSAPSDGSEVCTGAPSPQAMRSVGTDSTYVEFGPCGDLFWVEGWAEPTLWHMSAALGARQLLASGVAGGPVPTPDGGAVAYEADGRVCLRMLAAEHPVCEVGFVSLGAQGPVAWLANGHLKVDAEHAVVATITEPASPEAAGRITVTDLGAPASERTFEYAWLADLSPDGPDGGRDFVSLQADGQVLVVHRRTWVTHGDVSMSAPTQPIALLDVGSGEILTRFVGAAGTIRGFTADLDDLWIADASGTQLVFPLEAGGFLRLEYDKTITRVDDLAPRALSDDGQRLVAIDGDTLVRLVLETGERTGLGPVFEGEGLTISPNADAVVRFERRTGDAGGHRYVLWRTRGDGEAVAEHTLDGFSHIYAVSDGGLTVYAPSERTAVRILPSEGPARVLSFGDVHEVKVVPGGLLVLGGAYPGRMVRVANDGGVTTVVDERASEVHVDSTGQRFAAVVVRNPGTSGVGRTLVAGALSQ